MARPLAVDYEAMSDDALAACIVAGDASAVTLLIRRNNQRLFRAAWSVLKDRAEAEEVVQEGYMKAFAAIDRFEGQSSLSTWLTRIVVNHAISRARAAQRLKRSWREKGLAIMADYREQLSGGAGSLSPAPDEAIMQRQLSELLKAAIAQLPEPFRVVFVLHEIEGLSAEDIAEVVGAPAKTIRTRLFRARRRLRAILGPELKRAMGSAVEFAGADCQALTSRVVSALDASRSAARG